MEVKLKGNAVSLHGEVLKVGDVAPNFKFVLEDLQEKQLSDFSGKNKILMSVPSLDTPVCKTQTRLFNQKIADFPNTIGIVISADLPFAMKRFCETEGVTNVINASDFRYNDFGTQYHLLMTSGALQGLLARSVLVVDANDKIQYVELVADIIDEPNYEEALLAIKEITKEIN